jgi:hypothetical protein
MESENGEDSEAEAAAVGQPLLASRDSEQREIDEFEEEERRLLAEEAKVRMASTFTYCKQKIACFVPRPALCF